MKNNNSEPFIIAEVGINHNGDIKIAKELITIAKKTGCDAVKFQKRTIETVYTKEELDKPRESPWGNTQRKQKEGLEFSKKEYDEIDNFCKEKKIEWFASAWDVKSLEFLDEYKLNYNKIASAMITNSDFLKEAAKRKKYTLFPAAPSSPYTHDALLWSSCSNSSSSSSILFLVKVVVDKLLAPLIRALMRVIIYMY